MAENGNIPGSPHSEAARALLQQIRAIQESTGSTTMIDSALQRKLNALSAVSDELIESAAVVLDAHPQIAITAETSSAQLRDAIAYSLAYRPLVDELRLSATKLMQKITAVRAEAGIQSFKIYNIAKNLNRPLDKAMLVPHVMAMQRAIAKRRKKPLLPPAEEPEPATGVVKQT